MCDSCKVNLIKREDDSEEVFYSRYDEYLKKTSPLVDYYESKGLLVRVNDVDSNVIFDKVSSLVRNV